MGQNRSSSKQASDTHDMSRKTYVRILKYNKDLFTRLVHAYTNDTRQTQPMLASASCSLDRPCPSGHSSFLGSATLYRTCLSISQPPLSLSIIIIPQRRIAEASAQLNYLVLVDLPSVFDVDLFLWAHYTQTSFVSQLIHVVLVHLHHML